MMVLGCRVEIRIKVVIFCSGTLWSEACIVSVSESIPCDGESLHVVGGRVRSTAVVAGGEEKRVISYCALYRQCYLVVELVCALYRWQLTGVCACVCSNMIHIE